MPFPTPIVEICMGLGAYANDAEIAAYGAAQVPPTNGWENVTSWVRSLSTDRGRSDDWDDFYGSAQVVLNNRPVCLTRTTQAAPTTANCYPAVRYASERKQTMVEAP